MARGLAAGWEMRSRLGAENSLQTIRALDSTRKAPLWRRRARSGRWNVWSRGSNCVKKGEAAENLVTRVVAAKLFLGRDLRGIGEHIHVHSIVAGQESNNWGKVAKILGYSMVRVSEPP
jgi:hypothetical protein